MSEIWIPLSSGGGVDLDVITAGADDVLAPKVIVGSDGEPLTGTLALSGNANTVDVRKGKTFYSNNAKSKLTGAMAEKGAQTYTPGKTNQVIAANQFLTGAQTILGDADLIPDNIVYGKSIFNVQGNVRKYVNKSIGIVTAGNGVYNSEVRGNIYPITINNTGINVAVMTAGNEDNQRCASVATGSINHFISYASGIWTGSLSIAKLGYNQATLYAVKPGRYNVSIWGYV